MSTVASPCTAARCTAAAPVTDEDRKVLAFEITAAAQKARVHTLVDSPERQELNKIIRYSKRLYVDYCKVGE